MWIDRSQRLKRRLRSEIVRRETEILFQRAVWQAGQSKHCAGETFKIVLHSSNRASSLQLCAEEHIGRT